MHRISIDGMHQYHKVVKEVEQYGDLTNPRGMETIELSPACVCIHNPQDRVYFDHARRINIAFAWADWLAMISGTNSTEFLGFYNSKVKQFSDNGKRFYGAYGPRIAGHIPILTRILEKDLFTRQAVLSIYKNEDLYYNGKDTPCTSTIQFLVRDGKLHAVVNMRSNDVVWGFPYDVFMFSLLQENLANHLELEYGSYTHVAGSLHIYRQHWGISGRMRKSEPILDFNRLIVPRDTRELLEHEEICRKGMHAELMQLLNDPDIKEPIFVFGCYRLLKEKRYVGLKGLLDRNKWRAYNDFFYRSLNSVQARDVK